MRSRTTSDTITFPTTSAQIVRVLMIGNPLLFSVDMVLVKTDIATLQENRPEDRDLKFKLVNPGGGDLCWSWHSF